MCSSDLLSVASVRPSVAFNPAAIPSLRVSRRQLLSKAVTMDMPGMKKMPRMEPTSISSSRLFTQASFRITASNRASTQALLVPGALETEHRDNVAASELPNDAPMAPMPGMSTALHFGVGDTLWTKPLTPTNVQGYVGAMLLLITLALLLRFLIAARARTERRWNSGTPVCCNGLEANGILKVPHAQKDKADTSSGHSWDARKQFTRAAFTLATTTIGYFLLVSLS